MAEETKPPTEAQPASPAAEQAGKKTASGSKLVWIIMAAIVVVCAGSGIMLGKIFAKPQTKTPQIQEQNPSEEKPVKAEKKKKAAKSGHGAKAESGGHGGGHGGGEEKAAPINPDANWYYDLDPVVANLNEPGATRYVRATITLEISNEADSEEVTATFDEKKPILTDWLTIYLASLGLEDIRGDKNLKRIQSHILESLNEKFFGDSKPVIVSVLFKEFAIQ